jgi:Ca2+-binding RTX toxin-like protein
LTDGTYGAQVKKQFAVLALALVAVLLAAGQLARAAPAPREPQDTAPSFSGDARLVAYAEQRDETTETWVTPAGGGAPRNVGLVGRPRGFRPGSGSELLIESADTTTIATTSGTPVTSFAGEFASWSPDGGRIAYVFQGDLYVVDATNTNRRVVARGIQLPSWEQTGPVWSPNGTQLVLASGNSLLAVAADGSGARTLFTGANQSVNPTWSADGSLIAFERNAGPHWSIWVVSPDGSNAHELLGGAADNRYPRYSPVSSSLAFISDRRHIRGGATQYQYALYTSYLGGRPQERVADVHPYSPPAWSPTAAQLAVAAGHECNRWGIYVVRSDAYPLNAHRRSNQCRIDGTVRGDRLTGTPWLDIIRGLGGDDVIAAGAGNDRIEGNDGNDVISAGTGNDAIFGGPGDDVISAGAGNDLVIPGNGRDRIDCGPGIDVVEGSGPLDRIAKSCEHVRH